MDLTKRQQEIFDFIKRYSAKYGYPPTVRDIGKAVGLASSSTVHAHLANLEKIGLLRRDPSKPRAIEMLDRGSPTTGSCGALSAGRTWLRTTGPMRGRLVGAAAAAARRCAEPPRTPRAAVARKRPPGTAPAGRVGAKPR